MSTRMRFDIYGRFELEVRREGEDWVAYRTGAGLRRRDDEVMVPADMAEHEIVIYLDDLFHELAGSGERIRSLG